MLTRIGEAARSWAREPVPWTNVYGLARTLLALGTATTLAFTPTGYLFQRLAADAEAPACSGARAIGAFCLAPSPWLEPVRWLLVLLLLVIASGWRPRLTAPVHFWIAFSVANNATVVDGGDHVTLVLTVLLLPLALTDVRRWHWDPPASTVATGPREEAARFIARVALTLIRVQVACIYFHAAVGKFGVEEWVDGTAVYYFFQDPTFGGTPFVLALLRPVLRTPLVCAITWGTLVLEYLLSAALFMPRRYWRPLLAAGLALHLGIAWVHGLVSFGFAMSAALVLFLRPFDVPFELPRFARHRRRTEAEKTTLARRAPEPLAAPACS